MFKYNGGYMHYDSDGIFINFFIVNYINRYYLFFVKARQILIFVP